MSALHAEPAYAGALFQVASQFNLLEMVSERITPSTGRPLRRRPHPGPACAMAAGAATIYRNYLVPVGDGIRTAQRAPARRAGRCRRGAVGADRAARRGAVADAERLRAVHPRGLRAISDLLDGRRRNGSTVFAAGWPSGCTAMWRSPAFRSLMPGRGAAAVVPGVLLSASRLVLRAVPGEYGVFARLVLEAAYEATLLAAAEQAEAGAGAAHPARRAPSATLTSGSTAR